MDCELEPLLVAHAMLLPTKSQEQGPLVTQIDTCLSYKCMTCVTIGVAEKINELGDISSLNSHLGALLARRCDPWFQHKTDPIFTKKIIRTRHRQNRIIESFLSSHYISPL